MRSWHVLVAISFLFLTACATLQLQTTKLVPLGHDADAALFRFEAPADFVYPPGSPRAEAIRMGWLEQRLAASGYKNRPYSILAREMTVRPGVLADGYDLYYTVRVERCTPRQNYLYVGAKLS
jgi:hypothetical protein